MILLTKSIQKKRAVGDGVRICIMRRPDKNADFDIWMPTLAPSNKLLKAYHRKQMNWDEYEARYTKEVLYKNDSYIQILSEMAQKHKVTILCWEKTPEKCHRRLVAEACLNKYPNLPVTVR